MLWIRKDIGRSAFSVRAPAHFPALANLVEMVGRERWGDVFDSEYTQPETARCWSRSDHKLLIKPKVICGIKHHAQGLHKPVGVNQIPSLVVARNRMQNHFMFTRYSSSGGTRASITFLGVFWNEKIDLRFPERPGGLSLARGTGAHSG